MRRLPPFFALGSLALLAACNPSAQNMQDVEANATDAAQAARADADERALHLDEAAQGLDAQGRATGGGRAKALDAEANSDMTAAAVVAQGGDRQADQIDANDAATVAAVEKNGADTAPAHP